MGSQPLKYIRSCIYTEFRSYNFLTSLMEITRYNRLKRFLLKETNCLKIFLSDFKGMIL